MNSYAWILKVRPGYEEEYKCRHDALWPEMDATLRASGLTTYHIFRHGLDLIGYFETDDLQATIDYLKDDPVNAKWGEYMAPIMEIDIDSATGFPFLLPKQWSLDE